MLALGLVLNTVAVGLFCWLIFTLAVHALPLLVGVNVGLMAFHSGAGIVGAALVGIAAGVATLAVGRTAFAITRSLIVRASLAAAFAIPAAIAGYHLVLVVSQIAVPLPAWREVFADLGAVLIGGTAWTRLTLVPAPRPLEPGAAGENSFQPVLTAAPRER
jgi:hypothetical protein